MASPDNDFSILQSTHTAGLATALRTFQPVGQLGFRGTLVARCQNEQVAIRQQLVVRDGHTHVL